MGDDGQSDICADDCVLSGIDPELMNEIQKSTTNYKQVRQLMLDTDCLNWPDLYSGKTPMDVCSSISPFTEAMVSETGESIFIEQHQECLKTLPFSIY